MGEILKMHPKTYTAKIYSVACESGLFQVAGTLEGLVDLALPKDGTLQLKVETAEHLAYALNEVATDVRENCLEHDNLLED